MAQTDKLNWLEARKIEIALANRQSQLQEITSASSAENGIRQILKPVQKILKMRGMTVEDLDFVIGNRTHGVDTPEQDANWHSIKERFREIGIETISGRPEMPILHDALARSLQIVEVFERKQNLKRISPQIRSDLNILLAETNLSIDGLNSIKNKAHEQGGSFAFSLNEIIRRN